MSYGYDQVGNLSTLTYPSGRVVNYTYDTAGQLTQLGTTGVGTTNFTYNGRGLLTTTSLPNGVTENQAYNADSQLTSSELTNGTNSLYKKTNTYDAVGNVTQTGTSTNGAPATLEDFAYDPLSRLTGQTTDNTNQSLNTYSYNPVGNITGVNSATQTYDAAGKLTATGTQTISYDGRNNRSGVVDSTAPNNNVEYTWTQDNMLASVTTHTSGTPDTVSYSYNADQLLQNRTDGTTATDNFVWDTSRSIPVMLSDGKYEYIYSPKDQTPLAQIEIATGAVTYLHHDLNGSVTASTNSTGQLVGTVDYSPYGVATGPLLSRFGYAGEWVDGTTGYSYLRARWLDTSTGTFLSEDPMVQITRNAYCYTSGNPISQTDPLGLYSYGNNTAFNSFVNNAEYMFNPNNMKKGVMSFLDDDTRWKDLDGLSTTLGTISTVATMVSLIPIPIVSQIAGTTALVTGGASLAIGAASTARTCIREGMHGGIQSDCGWNVAITAASAIPFVGFAGKIIPGAKRAGEELNSMYQFASHTPQYASKADIAARTIPRWKTAGWYAGIEGSSTALTGAQLVSDKCF